MQAVLEDWGEWERAWQMIDEPDNYFPQLFAAKNVNITPGQFVEFAVIPTTSPKQCVATASTPGRATPARKRVFT